MSFYIVKIIFKRLRAAHKLKGKDEIAKVLKEECEVAKAKER